MDAALRIRYRIVGRDRADAGEAETRELTLGELANLARDGALRLDHLVDTGRGWETVREAPALADLVAPLVARERLWSWVGRVVLFGVVAALTTLGALYLAPCCDDPPHRVPRSAAPSTPAR